MKTRIILPVFALASIFFSVNAKVWRVNNNPGVQADFTTAQAAHDSASAGDTLYFEGSPILYGSIVLIKKLVIIGPGYLLDENKGLQANQYSATIKGLTFWCHPENNPTTSSAGSVVKGMYIGQSDINIYVSNISLIGNFIFGIQNQVIFLRNPISNISILKNFIYGIVGMTDATANNIIIKNNYLEGGLKFNNNLSSNGVIQNNIINGIIYVNSFSFKNNIFINSTDEVKFFNSIVNNNISISNQFGTDNGNQANVAKENIFIGGTVTYSDTKWQLKEGSPAIGAGEEGVDCGIFGGNTPYVLSGIPNIPTINYLNITNSPTDKIKVTVKSKTN
jgi:hypothetical protein